MVLRNINVVLVVMMLLVAILMPALIGRALHQRAHELVVCTEQIVGTESYLNDCMQYDR